MTKLNSLLLSAALSSGALACSVDNNNLEDTVQDVVGSTTSVDYQLNPCESLPNEVDMLSCELNENGYNVSNKDVIDLVRTIYFEADPTMGQHEYDTIAWSIRNQYDTAKVWETMDDSYPKGNTIEEILDQGAYYGNRGNQRYFDNHERSFKIHDMDEERTNKSLWSVYRAFMSDRSEDPTHGAQVYKHNDKTDQVWHNAQFGYLENSVDTAYDDVRCRTEHVGKITGVEHTENGEVPVTSSHTFYQVTCNVDGEYQPLLMD